MASFSGPKLSNRIADDVPAIQEILGSLAKLTPDSGNTDYPNGTKRVDETTNGYEFQQWNGSSWVHLEKWNINAQKVDGYSASTGTTASTIPVRDADGKLPGDITGNAATATKANELSETNPVAMGGTGATTAEQARKNLVVPPKSHASGSTEYGVGTETQYGHTMPHDAPDATLSAATGHALSPAGAAAMQETLEGQIGDLAGVVSGNAAAQNAKDAAQDAAISAAQSSADAAQSSADAAQSSADAAQSSADAARNSVPVGSLIMHAAGATPPGGFLFCNGAAVSRTTYAKLFEVIGVQFGKGDGKTTFNIPNCDSRFIEGGGAPGIIYNAGLPEIAAWWIGAYEEDSNIPGGSSGWGNGAVRTERDGYNYLEIPGKSSAGKMNYNFNASRSNGTYGASDTVQPPAITMCFFIKY